jgi:putative nucleotidyltransferase with HDIG domain
MTRIEPAQAQKNLGHLVRKINEVSTLPNVMTQILTVTNNPNSDVDDLSDVIKSDLALSVRVLKCVNSAAHGLRSKVTSLQQAVGYLGFRQVRNLTIAASVCESFKTDLRIGPYDRKKLWQHMVAVAVTSQMIAMQKSIRNHDEIFLAGLLHDIGIILEDQYMNEPFTKMMKNLPADATLVSGEKEWFGFDHTELGTILAKQWKLPAMVHDVIRDHHKKTFTGEFEQATACITLANMMCASKDFGSTTLPLPQIPADVMIRLGVEPHDIKPLVEQMEKQVSQNEELLNMAS